MPPISPTPWPDSPTPSAATTSRWPALIDTACDEHERLRAADAEHYEAWKADMAKWKADRARMKAARRHMEPGLRTERNESTP